MEDHISHPFSKRDTINTFLELVPLPQAVTHLHDSILKRLILDAQDLCRFLPIKDRHLLYYLVVGSRFTCWHVLEVWKVFV